MHNYFRYVTGADLSQSGESGWTRGSQYLFTRCLVYNLFKQFLQTFAYQISITGRAAFDFDYVYNKRLYRLLNLTSAPQFFTF